MVGVLRHSRIRLIVLLSILGGLVALAALTGIGSASGNGGTLGPTRSGEVRRLELWLGRVPLPTGVRRDATDTACLGDAPLCVTSSGTPLNLISSLRSALSAAGGSPGRAECRSTPLTTDDFVGCELFGTYGGAPFLVVAEQRVGYPQPASWAQGDARWRSEGSPKPEPLPSLRVLYSLGVLPHRWHLTVRCSVHLSGGCGRYVARATAPGSACGRLAQLADALGRANFSFAPGLQRLTLTPTGRPTRPYCLLGASRNLAPGGSDRFFFGAFLQNQAGGSSRGAIAITAT